MGYRFNQTVRIIGDITSINATKDHPHRQIFVDRVLNDPNIKSILEVGPGELIEYQRLKGKKDIQYSILDLNHVFMSNCQKRYPEIKTHFGCIEDIIPFDFEIHGFDLVYVSHVLEHTHNVVRAIKNICHLGKRYHVVMFKWMYDGNLESRYYKGKKFYSSCFDPYKIIDMFKERSVEMDDPILVCRNGETKDFNKYSEGKSGVHRTGDYLLLRGNVRV